MASNKFLTGVMAVAATISVAALAGCPATTPGPVGPSATPSGTPSTTPSTTPNPSESPSTPAPTALPSSADTQSVATIRGLVEDESGNRLDGVTITAKVLSSGATFANGSDSLTVTSVNGAYVLNGAPTGVIVEVIASKSGYSERRLAITPLANTTGQGNVNDLDFTNANNKNNALSDRPEILSITPGEKTTGVDPATSFTLTFSTPMDKKSAEDNFRIAINADQTGLEADKTAVHGIAALGADGDFGKAGNILYDGSYFNKEWSANNTVLTLTWKDSNHLITDKDSGDAPEYAVFFTAGVKNANGTQAASASVATSNLDFTPNTFKGAPYAGNIAHQIFRIGTQSKSKVTFTVAADTSKPQVDSGLVLLNEGAGASKARIKFNERMTLGTLFGSYGFNAAITARANYTPTNITFDTASTPPTTVVFYADDQSKKTLEFNKLTFGTTGSQVIKVSTNVKDPAGNDIDKDYEEAKGVI